MSGRRAEAAEFTYSVVYSSCLPAMSPLQKPSEPVSGERRLAFVCSVLKVKRLFLNTLCGQGRTFYRCAANMILYLNDGSLDGSLYEYRMTYQASRAVGHDGHATESCYVHSAL